MGNHETVSPVSLLPAWINAEELIVLVLRRDTLQRQALVGQLIDEGFGNVGEAETAAEAFAWLHDREHPDIVICDCEEDRIDGLQFCNMVRRDPNRKVRAIPVVLLLNTPEPLVHEVALQAGAAAVVVKPVAPRALAIQIYQAVGQAKGIFGPGTEPEYYTDLEIARVLSNASGPTDRRATAQEGFNLVGEWSSPEEYGVLVVESETAMRKMIVQMLRQKGFRRTEEVASGAKALFLLQMGYLPDIVVCNVDSRTDHWEVFCDGIRDLRVEALKNLPIVLVTGKRTEELERIAAGIGFTTIVELPASVDDLACSVHKMVG